jgi:hypothetical protein
MPTLEPDFELAERIPFEAAQQDSLAPQQAEWIEAFYQNVESRMLNLYGVWHHNVGYQFLNRICRQLSDPEAQPIPRSCK